MFSNTLYYYLKLYMLKLVNVTQINHFNQLSNLKTTGDKIPFNSNHASQYTN